MDKGKAAANNRFGIMAAGRWSNQQQFAINRQFPLKVYKLSRSRNH